MKLEPVINRCNYDIATDFGSFWSYVVVQLSKDLGLNYANLEKAKAMKANWDLAINEREDAFVCGVGHGNDSLYTGQSQNILLDSSKYADIAMLKDKYGSFLSCRFGKSMQKFLGGGMKSFMGYSEDFIFGFYNASNRADPIAATFGDSHFKYDTTFISEKYKDTPDGQADKLAYEASQARFQKHFDEARNMNHKQLLLYDKLIQVHGSLEGEGPSQPPIEGTPVVQLTIRVNDEIVHDQTYLDPVNVETSIVPFLVPTPKETE